MIIEVDARTVPPVAHVREAEDCGSLSIRFAVDGHGWVDPDWIVGAVGDLAENDDWRANFNTMIAYAVSKGWSDAGGALRAHIEWPPQNDGADPEIADV